MGFIPSYSNDPHKDARFSRAKYVISTLPTSEFVG